MGLRKKISINKDIRKAYTLPSMFYKERKYFDISIDNLFSNSWQFISDINSIKNTNVYPFSFLDDTIEEPMILTKNNKEYIMLSNVCTHRGSILCEEENKYNKVQCKYHGRIFNLKGEFQKAPGFENVKFFPTKKDNLKKFPLKLWKQFLFCSLKGKIKIDHIFKDIENRLENYPFNKLFFDKKHSKIYLLDAHWSLYCENYLEGFHVPFIHKGLNNDIDFKTYNTILFDNGVLQYTKETSSKINTKEKSLLENTYAYYYWIFPNIMLNFYNWGLSINIIEPISKNKTRVRFLSYPIKGCTQPIKNSSSLDKVEKEDQEIIKKVQKGINSQSYLRGRYSAMHEKGIHHFHQLICKYIN